MINREVKYLCLVFFFKQKTAYEILGVTGVQTCALPISVDGIRPLTSADTKSLAYSVLTDAQKHRFEENLELDFSFGVRGLSRFRANLFNQRGAVGAVFRAIPYEIKSFEVLGLPPVVSQLCDRPRGLILVTGPTDRKSAG